VLGELGAGLGDRLGHLPRMNSRPLRLLERIRMISCVTPVILMSIWSAVIPVLEPATWVHVTEVILGALDVGQDHVVVAFLHEAHRDRPRARSGRRRPSAESRPADRAIDASRSTPSVSDTSDRVREVLGDRIIGSAPAGRAR
jgi:hypothetical protein